MIIGQRYRGRLRFVAIFGAAASFIFLIALGNSTPASAATPTYNTMNPHDRAESYILYYDMLHCFTDVKSINNSDVISQSVAGLNGNSVSSWFLDQAIGDNQDGLVECGTAETAAMKLWSYSNFDQMLTDWGYKNPGNNNDWTNDNPGTSIGAALRKRIFSNATPQFTADAQYVYYRTTLDSACKISNPVDYSDPKTSASLKSAADSSSGDYLKVTEPTPNFLGTITNIYKITGDYQPPTVVDFVFPENSPLNSASLDCKQIAQRASSAVQSYLNWAVNNKVEATKGFTGSSNGTASQPGVTTCSSEIGGAGWIVCPVINLLATINDGILKFLSSAFLSPNIGLFDTTSGTYTAWSVFRSYANIAFVIVFLIIIYAQVTSVGVSNYGIKRMLPRLIIAAILVNISFYLCQAAIDISNILGYGLNNLFESIPAVQGAKDVSLPTWKTVTGIVLAGVGLAGLVIGLLLAISVPVIIASLLAAGMIVLILLVREAAIVLLVVISPLAFVAYLLPNTEQWFKKWYKMFSTLLLVFPLIAVVFGASSLAGKIISNTAGKESGEKSITLQLTALGMATIPLFVVPSLLKGSLAATGSLGTKLQGMGNRATGKIGARAKDSTYAGAYIAQRKKIKAATRAQGYGTGIRGRISRSRFSGRAGTELGATGSALASREEKEAVDNEIIRMQKQKDWTEATKIKNAHEEFVGAMRNNDSTRARAAQSILLSSGNKGIQQLQESFKSLEGEPNYNKIMTDEAGQKVLSDLNSSGLKGKNAALAGFAYGTPGDAKVSAIATSAGTYTGLNDAELAGQSMENIQNAIDSGGITKDRAIGMMGNQNVWSQLSEDKKMVIRMHAEGISKPEDLGRTHDIRQARREALVENAEYDLEHNPPEPPPSS